MCAMTSYLVGERRRRFLEAALAVGMILLFLHAGLCASSVEGNAVIYTFNTVRSVELFLYALLLFNFKTFILNLFIKNLIFILKFVAFRSLQYSIDSRCSRNCLLRNVGGEFLDPLHYIVVVSLPCVLLL